MQSDSMLLEYSHENDQAWSQKTSLESVNGLAHRTRGRMNKFLTAVRRIGVACFA